MVVKELRLSGNLTREGLSVSFSQRLLRLEDVEEERAFFFRDLEDFAFADITIIFFSLRDQSGYRKALRDARTLHSAGGRGGEYGMDTSNHVMIVEAGNTKGITLFISSIPFFMSWRTSPLALGLRNVTRRLGLNSWIVSTLGNAGYEDSFQKAMLQAVRPGDCIWDVGANVGLYTTQFAKLTGPEGRVFAFEPSPHNEQRLRKTVEGLNHVITMPLALGDKEDTVTFQQGEDPLGATSRVLSPSESGASDTLQIRMTRGSTLVNSGEVLAPNVIKIDTEGYELDVLLGLGDVLRTPGLRTLCIEVHFTLLKERGLEKAPTRIEEMLKESGFTCRWPDWSHLVAQRPSA